MSAKELSHDTARCMGMGVQHASQPQAEFSKLPIRQ